MYPNQPNFGGQNNTGPGGAQGDFGSFGMNGGVGASGINLGMNQGGDVVFTSAGIPEKKNKKKFIIIGAVVGVLVIVLVVLVLVFSSGGSGGLFSGGAPAGFNELREFIEKGDAETRALFEDEDGEESSDEEDAEGDSEESEYIMAIRISEQNEAEVRKYYAKLAKLEQDFYKKSVDKVDAELLSEYENALKVLKNAINYYEAKEGLIAAYENGGESGAEVYFEENISCSDGAGDGFSLMCDYEKEYYRILIKKHKLFSDAGCCEEEGCDFNCVESYYENVGSDNLESMLAVNGDEDAYLSELNGNYVISVINDKVFGLNGLLTDGEK